MYPCSLVSVRFRRFLATHLFTCLYSRVSTVCRCSCHSHLFIIVSNLSLSLLPNALLIFLRRQARQAFVKKKGELPAISIELVQAADKTITWRQTQPASQIVVGETYVVNEDIAVHDDELLLSDGEHVRVLSGDGQGNYLVETKDGESGWISQQHLRDDRQSEAMKSRGRRMVLFLSG